MLAFVNAFLIQLFVLWLVSQSTEAATTHLDLSYLHRVKAPTLAKAIQENINDNLNIDVSASFLGKGIKDLILALKSTATIELVARLNQWTPDDVTLLLTAILGTGESKPNEQKTGGEEKNSEDLKIAKGDASEEIKEPTEPDFATVASLDLGWNDLGQELTGTKGFLKALQKLVESQERCPQTVRLDLCGLGPAACRALGKVRCYSCRR
jgi:hypothetical protein